MNCKRCGATVTADSIFCNKCGNKLEGVEKYDWSRDNSTNGYQSMNFETPNHQNSNYNGTGYTNPSYNMNLHKYPRRRINLGKLFIVFMIMGAIAVVLGVIGYKKYYNYKLGEARRFYSEGKYRAAYYQINNLVSDDETDEEIKRIIYSSDYGYYYQLYQEEMERSHPDYQSAIDILFSGLDKCKSYEKDAGDAVEKEVIKLFIEKYSTDLKDEFELSQKEIDDILKLNDNARNDQFIEIAYKYIQKKNNK